MYHLNSADGTINYIRIATERSNSIKLGENHRLLSIDRRFSIFNRAESDARRETKKKEKKKPSNLPHTRRGYNYIKYRDKLEIGLIRRDPSRRFRQVCSSTVNIRISSRAAKTRERATVAGTPAISGPGVHRARFTLTRRNVCR